MRLTFLTSLIGLALLAFSCTKNNSLTSPDGNETLNLTLRDTVEAGTLPAAILDYINTNYPNASITLAESGTEDNGALVYEVTLSSGEALVFDENGNFLGLDDHEGDNEHNGENEGNDDGQTGNHEDENGPDDQNEGGEGHENELTLDQLPQAIQDFIQTNFAGLQLEDAELDTLCDGTVAFLIRLEDAQHNDLELAFNETGGLLYQATSVAIADLPQAVLDGLASNYPDYKVDEDVDLLTLSNGSTQYSMELELNTASGNSPEKDLIIVVATDGSIICEKME